MLDIIIAVLIIAILGFCLLMAYGIILTEPEKYRTFGKKARVIGIGFVIGVFSAGIVGQVLEGIFADDTPAEIMTAEKTTETKAREKVPTAKTDAATMYKNRREECKKHKSDEKKCLDTLAAADLICATFHADYTSAVRCVLKRMQREGFWSFDSNN